MKFRRLALRALLSLLSLVLLLDLAAARAWAQDQKSETSDYLSSQESEIVAEINLARTHPQEYAAHLEQLRNYYEGNKLRRPGQEAETTTEGVRAVEEAIKFLRAAKPLPPLGVAKGMCLAARDHLKDLEQTDSAGHKGSDGTVPEDRLSRYGSWNKSVGENIAYNSSAARDMVIGWIIDDGTPSRGHRQAIFNAEYSTTGIAMGKSSTYGPLCVSVFTGGFTEKPAAGNSTTAKPAAKKF